MLLRRVIQHLRKQEWMAVAIDFVIVVVGVFVGLQVNDWGAAQAAKRRGDDYVERLSRDMEKDLASRRNLVAYYDAVYESAERTNALLRQSSPDPTALVVSAYRATEYAYMAPTRSTWDEVVSSGDIDLLPRAAVEGGLSDYFADDTARNAMEAMRGSAYRHRVRGVIPHEVQRAIREGCGDVRDPRDQSIIRFREDCRLDVSEGEIAAAAQALQRDPRVREDLRYQFSDIGNARTNLRGDVAQIEIALRGLEEAR
jgi:hypothetical protein